MPKCIAAINAHFRTGTSGFLSPYGLPAESCVGYAASAVKRKCENVINRPEQCQLSPNVLRPYIIPLLDSLLSQNQPARPREDMISNFTSGRT